MASAGVGFETRARLSPMLRLWEAGSGIPGPACAGCRVRDPVPVRCSGGGGAHGGPVPDPDLGGEERAGSGSRCRVPALGGCRVPVRPSPVSPVDALGEGATLWGRHSRAGPGPGPDPGPVRSGPGTAEDGGAGLAGGAAPSGSRPRPHPCQRPAPAPWVSPVGTGALCKQPPPQ